jgi:hypothetical protein
VKDGYADSRDGIVKHVAALNELQHARKLVGHWRVDSFDIEGRVLSSRAMVSLRRFAAGVILAICVGAPVLEMFDQWDRTLQDGNDTEINLVVVALCVGVAFSVAPAIVARLRAPANSHRCFVPTPASLTTLLTFATPIPNRRPPTSLRV